MLLAWAVWTSLSCSLGSSDWFWKTMRLFMWEIEIFSFLYIYSLKVESLAFTIKYPYCQTQWRSQIPCIPYCQYPHTYFILSSHSQARLYYQESSVALSLWVNIEKNVSIIRSPSRRAESQTCWELKSGISGLHKVDAAKAVMAGCWLFKQHTERGKWRT